MKNVLWRLCLAFILGGFFFCLCEIKPGPSTTIYTSTSAIKTGVGILWFSLIAFMAGRESKGTTNG